MVFPRVGSFTCAPMFDACNLEQIHHNGFVCADWTYLGGRSSLGHLLKEGAAK